MQGFKYLEFDGTKKFTDVWDELCENFNPKKKIKKFSDAYNFNDKEVYENYDIYGELLGEILNTQKITFSDDETIGNETTTVLD